jgi:hypothetical protein
MKPKIVHSVASLNISVCIIANQSREFIHFQKCAEPFASCNQHTV